MPNGLTSVLAGVWGWVWTETPSDLNGLTGGIVRAANGASFKSPSGFDFLENYRGWKRATTKPLIAWTFLYATSDGAEAGAHLAEADAVAYIIDWEDWQGQTASAKQLLDCVTRLKSLRPGRPIGFSSYPTAAQALAHAVDWYGGIAVCDFVAPQMYYRYQEAEYSEIIADAGARYVQLDLSPADGTNWADDAARHLVQGEGVSLWRLGTMSAADRLKAAQLTEEFSMALGPDGEKFIQDDTDRQTRMLDHGDPAVGGHDYHHKRIFLAVTALANTIASSHNALAVQLGDLTRAVDQLAQGGTGAVDIDALLAQAGIRLASKPPLPAPPPPPVTAAEELPPPAPDES